MCLCDPCNSPIWRNRVSLYTALTVRVLESEFHLNFFFTQPNYAELKFHKGQTNCCYDFCGNQLLGKLVFSLSIKRGLVTVFGCHPATPRGRDPGWLIFGSEVWDGRRLVATSGRWGRWCGSDHPPVRLYVGSTQGFCHGSRTYHRDVCRSAVSIECWCLLLIYTMLRDIKYNQIQIDHNIQIYIYT